MYEDRFSILDIGTLFGANAFGIWLMSRYLKRLAIQPTLQVIIHMPCESFCCTFVSRILTCLWPAEQIESSESDDHIATTNDGNSMDAENCSDEREIVAAENCSDEREIVAAENCNDEREIVAAENISTESHSVAPDSPVSANHERTNGGASYSVCWHNHCLQEPAIVEEVAPTLQGVSVQSPVELVLSFDLEAEQPQAQVTLTLDNPSLMIAGKCRLNTLHHYRVDPARFLMTSGQVWTATLATIINPLVLLVMLNTAQFHSPPRGGAAIDAHDIHDGAGEDEGVGRGSGRGGDADTHAQVHGAIAASRTTGDPSHTMHVQKWT